MLIRTTRLTWKQNLLASAHYLIYHLRTIWLFTTSDHFTFVLPQTMFGILGALSGPALTTNSSPKPGEILNRSPLVLAWTWLNTFVFTLSNQGSEAAMTEDALNKSWRPLPSGRITLPQTRHLLMLTIPTVLAACYFHLGSFEETAVLFSLTWIYNELGGGDSGFILRNLIIATAYGFYGSGALRVAIGYPQHLPLHYTTTWLCVVGAVIFTTMSVQDLKDQKGDLARGRRTAVLVMGDELTRAILATAVLAWSFIGGLFWHAPWYIVAACAGLGAVVAGRLLRSRGRESDRLSWKIWSLWLISLYF